MGSRGSKRRSRPCRYCRRWFRPSPRVGERQYACSAAACQARRQRENEEGWHAAHPGFMRRRREQRASGGVASATLAAGPPGRRGLRNATPLAQQLVALEVIPAEALRPGMPAALRNKLVPPQSVVLIGLVAGLLARDANKEIDLAPRACYQRGRRLLKEVMPP